jgi:hypothetical protein
MGNQMKLHTLKDDFRDLITATAQAMNIREVYVEKDYWVTFLLKRLTQAATKDNFEKRIESTDFASISARDQNE